MYGRGRDEEGEDTRTCMGGAGMRRRGGGHTYMHGRGRDEEEGRRTHVHAWAGQE